MADEQPTVPMLSCPKCGSDDVRMTHQPWTEYHEYRHKDCHRAYHGRSMSLPEHFHRTCQRCHYQWPTFDVLGVKY